MKCKMCGSLSPALVCDACHEVVDLLAAWTVRSRNAEPCRAELRTAVKLAMATTTGEIHWPAKRRLATAATIAAKLRRLVADELLASVEIKDLAALLERVAIAADDLLEANKRLLEDFTE